MADLNEFQRAKLLDDLTALEDENDIILVDCGAGIGQDVVSFAGGADYGAGGHHAGADRPSPTPTP